MKAIDELRETNPIASTPIRKSAVEALRGSDGFLIPNYLSPLRKPTRVLNSLIAETPNDDEAEREKRRSSADLQKRIDGISSRSVQESADKSTSNLESHFAACVQLFSENKINMRNAWDIHIIDYLHTATKSSLVSNAFQLASTTLDIGAKVYGLRVDDVHARTLQLVGDFTRFNKKRSREEEDDQGDGEQNQSAESQRKKPKAKRRRPRATMVATEEALNGVLQSHDFNLNEDMSNDNCMTDKMYSYALPLLCGKYLFIKSNEKNFKMSSDAATEASVNTLSLEAIPCVESLAICPALSGFEICDWKPDDEKNATVEDVAYDDNNLPIPEVENAHDWIFQGGQDDDVDSIGCDDNEHQFRDDIEHIVDLKPGNEIGVASEYSYRAVNGHRILNVWAGPAHWKVASIKQKRPSEFVLRAEIKKKKRVTHEISIVDCDDPIDTAIFLKKRRNMQKRRPFDKRERFTLPENMSVTKEDLHYLSLKAKLRYFTEKERENYDHNNQNDSQNCAPVAGGDDWHDDDDNPEEDGSDFLESQSGCIGDNLIPAPDMVPTNTMRYAVRSKKMDIKKLKRAIWLNMTKDLPNQPNVEENLYQRPVVKSEFSEICHKIPKFLSAKMREDLSVPYAFAALLQLANEFNLHLEKPPDQEEVIITQDSQ